MFRSLRHRNFRLFFIGQGISQVGNWLTLVAQSLLVLHLGGNGLAVGVLSACQFLPVLLLGSYGGVVSDRSDRRRLLIVVQTIAMLQSFTMAFVASRPNPSLVWIDLVAVVSGITMAFDNPARRSLFVELVDESEVSNAVGLNSSLMTSSRVVGPAIAGLLIATVGYAWCFVVDGASYVAVLVALAMMNTEAIRSAPITARARGQIRAGWRYVRHTRELWISLLMMAVVGTLAFNFGVVLPLLVTRTFGADALVYSALFSVLSIGSLAGALYAARRPDVGVREVAIASVAFGVALLALAASPTLWSAFPIAAAVGFASILFLTASTAIVQVRADPAMRGRVLALQAMVFLGTTPIGAPIVGAISDRFGARTGLVVGGVAALAAGAFGLIYRDARQGTGVSAKTDPIH